MKTYLYVLIALAVLTVTTTAVAFVDLGSGNLAAALLIAAMKVSLVAFYFMHLHQARTLVKLVAAGGLFWLGVMLLLSFNDYISRWWIVNPSMWP